MEGSGENKQPLAEGDRSSLAAILNALKAMSRVVIEMNDRAEVDRIITEQQKASEAESKLNEIIDLGGK